MISMQTITPYIIPGIPDLKLENENLIYTPSLVKVLIENEFNIPGMIFYKNRSPQYSIPRYLFIYMLRVKMKVSPEIIRIIYGVKHDSCWQAIRVINDILDSRTPRHHYIRCTKIIQKIRKWDITEITLLLESKPVKNAQVSAYRRNTLELITREAQYTRQEPVLVAEDQGALKLPSE